MRHANCIVCFVVQTARSYVQAIAIVDQDWRRPRHRIVRVLGLTVVTVESSGVELGFRAVETLSGCPFCRC